MNSGYIFIISSVLCSLGVAHILRYSKNHHKSVSLVITVNYAIASLVALGDADLTSISLFTWITAIITGLLFIANFYLFAESVKVNGIGASVAAMRTSLIIPVSASVLFFNENFGLREIMAASLIGVSLYFLQNKEQVQEKTKKLRSVWLLLLLFVFSGFADFSAKVFHENKNATENPYTFMFIVFTVAFITGLFLVIKEKKAINSHEILTGIALGIPNLFSSIFLIQALGYLPAILVYPAINCTIIVLGTVLGLLYWKDNMQQKQWYGIGLALAAIIILIQ
jgi:drug/metabolite transporter (DMT)-like permease